VIPPRLLASTTYTLTLAASVRYTGILDHPQNCCEFTLRELDSQFQNRPGVLGIRLPWTALTHTGLPPADPKLIREREQVASA
jgi:hypothetical protein